MEIDFYILSFTCSSLCLQNPWTFCINHRESLAQSPFIDILRLFLFTSAQIAQCDFSDLLELRSPTATISRTFVSLQYKNCWKPKSNIHYLIPPHQYHWTSHRVNSLCCLVPEVLRFCIVKSLVFIQVLYFTFVITRKYKYHYLFWLSFHPTGILQDTQISTQVYQRLSPLAELFTVREKLHICRVGS